MNSYFTNSSLSCHLTGAHEVLPNVALSNSSTYDPVVRHFPSTYGAANRMYRAPFYPPQEDVMFGASRAPYDYGSNAFYSDKDAISGCRQSFAQDFTTSTSLEQCRSACQDQKSGSIQIYPWMQRMNSHSGEFTIFFYLKRHSALKGVFFYNCHYRFVFYCFITL